MATEAEIPLALDTVSLAVLVEVRGMVRQLVQALEVACRQVGLTESQQHALLCVAAGECRGETVTATALLDHLATDKNTVADIVRRLEAHGLLARQRLGREIALTLTPAGRARFVASLETIGRELGDKRVALIAPRLQRQLEHYLTIYRELLEDSSDEGRTGPPRSGGAVSAGSS
ncbi:MAG: hypothetical protein M1296_04750 [Chloroflexi bacterium]|nr:hypothetical protein [Chloroflexota bacterium]